jgi:hypothetical protein
VLSGDGSSLRTGSSPYGVKVCDCRKKGIFNCDCKRRFSDPEASWGWEVCVMNITMDILCMF